MTQASIGDSSMRAYEMSHICFGRVRRFSEADAPDWLTSVRQVPGSTMDTRGFWRDHVLALAVGESVNTDFHTITRLPDTQP